jgi:hypothetical protein
MNYSDSEPEDPAYTCGDCDTVISFPTKSALKRHKANKHQQRTKLTFGFGN